MKKYGITIGVAPTILIVLYAFGVAVIGHTTATTPVVNIPDANLRAAIEKAIGKPEDAAITAAGHGKH